MSNIVETEIKESIKEFGSFNGSFNLEFNKSLLENYPLLDIPAFDSDDNNVLRETFNQFIEFIAVCSPSLENKDFLKRLHFVHTSEKKIFISIADNKDKKVSGNNEGSVLEKETIKFFQKLFSEFLFSLSGEFFDFYIIEYPKSVNPLDSFENFSAGQNNLLSYSLTKTYSNLNNDLSSFSLISSFKEHPLLIFGNKGLGKTFLLNAAAVSYIERCAVSERETNLYFGSVRDFYSSFVDFYQNQKNVSAFFDRFKDLELLLIEDFDWLIEEGSIRGSGKIAKLFFDLVHSLISAGCRVILSSRRAPTDFLSYNEQLFSFISSYQSAQITNCDHLLKTDIIKKYLSSLQKTNLYSDEMISYVVEKNVSDISVLKNLVFSVLCYGEIMSCPINSEIIDHIYLSLVKPEDHFSLSGITATVVRYFQNLGYKVDENDLRGGNRGKDVSLIRHFAMYFCLKYSSFSCSKIGSFFGGRDHSAVLYANKKLLSSCSLDATIGKLLHTIEGSFSVS